MNNIKPKLITLVLSSIMFSGCVLYSDKLNYQFRLAPKPQNAFPAKAHASPISIGTILDQRGEDPKVIIHKLNGYGDEMPGSYIADRPVSVLMQESLNQGLERIGYKIRPNAHVQLQGEINSIKSVIDQNLWNGTLKLRISITLKLTSGTKTLWSQNIIGHGKSTTVMESTSDINSTLNDALNDIINQIQVSKKFHSAIGTA